MSRSISQHHDFGKALRYARKTLRFSREDFGLVASPQYVGTLERQIKSPTLGMVEKLASVMAVHPLVLLTLAYGADEANDAALETLLSEVHSQILSMRSDRTLATAQRLEALGRLKQHLNANSQRKKITAPQDLIDQAFANDDEAIAWFKTSGLTLVPGRLQGLPALANIFRNAELTNE